MLVALLCATGCSHEAPFVRIEGRRTERATWSAHSRCVEAQSRARTLAHRLIVVGDAGVEREERPVLERVEERSRAATDQTTVIFLGDNVYPDGLPPEGHERRSRAEGILRRQVRAAAGATTFFVAGNHDWDRWRSTSGLAAALRMRDYLRTLGSELRPYRRFPIPDHEPFEGGRIVFLDTQWWLHDGRRCSGEDARCEDGMEEQILGELGRLLDGDPDEARFVIGHHPLISHGRHGGRFHPGWYMGVVTALYPLVRAGGATRQDVGHSAYRHMKRELLDAMAGRRVLAYVAGHEHSLQITRGHEGPRFHLISGSGAKATFVRHGRGSRLAVSRLGFMEIDVLRDRAVLIRSHMLYGAHDFEVHAMWLRPPEHGSACPGGQR